MCQFKRIFSCLFSFILSAGEVDHTLVWGHPLNNAVDELNLYYNNEIKIALKNLPDNCDCRTAAGKILEHFGVTLNSPLEYWIKESSAIDKYPPVNMPQEERYKNSIFKKRGSKAFELRQNFIFDYMIDELININGIYTGIDKLTHFTGSGYIYYRIYIQRLNQGDSPKDAIERSIMAGVTGEKTLLGRIASGVFSFADLEANFQGLTFALDICRDNDPLLIKSARRWVLLKPFDIADYVNPYWDESYNPSFYYEGQNLTFLNKSETVSENLPSFCEQYHSPPVQNLFKYYDELAIPSFSVKFLKKLILSGQIPDPASFDLRNICDKTENTQIPELQQNNP
ncbi:MAG: hypothetical protein V3S48_03445 [Candidatus Neomarinimicrobiota bacterium]